MPPNLNPHLRKVKAHFNSMKSLDQNDLTTLLNHSTKYEIQWIESIELDHDCYRDGNTELSLFTTYRDKTCSRMEFFRFDGAKSVFSQAINCIFFILNEVNAKRLA